MTKQRLLLFFLLSASFSLLAQDLQPTNLNLFGFNFMGFIGYEGSLSAVADRNAGCPEGFVESETLIWNPLNKVNILFPCLKEERRVYQMTQADGTTIEATSNRNSDDELQLSSFRVFYANHGVKSIINFTVHGELNREEQYDEEGNMILKFSREAGKLERFDVSGKIIASCQYHAEENEIRNNYKVLEDKYEVNETYKFHDDPTQVMLYHGHQVKITRDSSDILKVVTELREEQKDALVETLVETSSTTPETQPERQDETRQVPLGRLELLRDARNKMDVCFKTSHQKVLVGRYKFQREDLNFNRPGVTMNQIINVLENPRSDVSEAFFSRYELSNTQQ